MRGDMMSVLLARYEIADLDAFLRVFDAFEPTRKEYGSTGHRVLRSPDSERLVTVIIDFDSPEHARAFASGEERAAALEEAGVRHRHDEFLDVVTE
jgi:quinol monooxygenase YgiN